MDAEDPKTQPEDFEYLGPLDIGDEGTVVYHDGFSGDKADTVEEVPHEISASTDYRLVSLIGRGGMGLVYRAHDLRLQRDVAVKVLRHEYADNPRITSRFINESLIKSSLQHPGIAPIYDTGEFPDGRPFYAMKLVEGVTLHHLLASREGEGDIGLFNVIAQVCQTMAYVHSMGIVHLDLKPSNVMVGDFGRVLVIDWGLARRLGAAEGFSPEELNSTSNPELLMVNEQPGWVRGTPAYMSPEQARGEPVDRRSDVFSLGAMLCEIVTGYPAYRGDTPRQLLRRAIRGATSQAMVELEHSQTELWLIGLVKRCLAADPEGRPADASVLAHELSDFQESALQLVESDMVRFFELSPDLFCIAGFDGCFRRVNLNFPRVMGLTEHELLSQPFMNFVHPDDKQRTLEVMGRLLQGQAVSRFRNRYLTGQGNVLQLEWTAKPVITEGLIFAVARDVTPKAVS